MRYTILILLIVVCFASCNDSINKEIANGITDSTTIVAEESSYYKRFSGTIAGQPVVLHLHKNQRLLSATYYYVKQGKPISLYLMADSVITNGYNAEESVSNRDANAQPAWKVVVSGSTIKGHWLSADRKKTYNIDLQEDYPQGSYKLSTVEIIDSIPLKAHRAEPSASVYYQLLVPGSETTKDLAAFYERTMLKELGDDSAKASNIPQHIKTQIENYGNWYREQLADVPDSSLGEAWNNYYTGLEMQVVNNDNGWLVVEFNVSDYTGGAHGMYGVSYANIDMQGKKLWKLEDVLAVDSARLQSVLETEGRKYFGIPAGAELSDHILTDRIMPNGNFYITATGIIFTYNPYEIASFADGIISLFIPYASVKDLLKPAFKQRMGMQ